MIIRIYRVRIKPELRSEFEPLFQLTVRSSVTKFVGFSRLTVGGPSELTPNKYAIISDWSCENSLSEFAGTDCVNGPESAFKIKSNFAVHKRKTVIQQQFGFSLREWRQSGQNWPSLCYI